MFPSIKIVLLKFVKEKTFQLLIAGFILGLVTCFLGLSLLNNGSALVGGSKASENISDAESMFSDNTEITIVVDLSGAVKNPGVYKLSEDARIADLLNLGGGVLNEASGKWVSRNLNLSRKLTDSDKVYIPFEWEITQDSVSDVAAFIDLSEPAVEGSSSNISGDQESNGSKINVNTTSAESLDSLPGIGPAYAQKIIDNRPYTDINDLQELTKIPASTLDKLKDLISF